MIYSVLLLVALLGSALATPLDDYVWRLVLCFWFKIIIIVCELLILFIYCRVDENYGWVEMPQHNLQGSFGNRSWVGYALNMTSQRWLTDADFAPNSDCKSLWWHYLFVIVPSEVKWVNNGTHWIFQHE
jgi:hypothetical protein